ncbi:hypothetical protein ABZ942_02665 [Nocardia sp. NPDC046473]|uniref:hypothetical protein n=1 Tax=Nocardia sp. NPDC046473 TaxID=3155733 RepID=UPI0033F0B765
MVTDHLNKATEYVVSSPLEDPEWANTVILRGIDDIRAVQAGPATPIRFQVNAAHLAQ